MTPTRTLSFAPSVRANDLRGTPIPASARPAVLSIPSLIDLNTQSGKYGVPDFDSKRVTFFGRLTHTWAKNSASHWAGCDFANFISRSDDVYPVGLVALALSDETASGSTTLLPINGSKSYFTMGGDGFLRFKNAAKHESQLQPNLQPFISNFTNIYGVNYIESGDDMKFNRTADINLFRPLVADMERWDEKVYGLLEVSPEPTQLRFDRFNDGEDFRALLVPWTLGQGDNMWNCVKLAEAWARMISKRAVRASFIRYPEGTKFPSLVNDSLRSFRDGQNYNATWNSFLTEFQKARSLGGRAKKEYDRLKAVCEVEKNESAAEITTATKEMETVERQVDPTFLAKYKRARVHHNMPVVPVVNEKCSGCNMSIPMAVIKKLTSQETVLECENCGRILYYQK